MNMTKKGKIITIFTIVALCIAIVTTACLIFTPNYKGEDVDVTNAEFKAYNDYNKSTSGNYGYGMKKDVTYNKDNSALVVNGSGSDDHIWMYVPTRIDMDVSETLDDLGYYYQYVGHYGNSANGDYHNVLFHDAMGYFSDSADTSSNEGNIEKYFSSYGYSASVENGTTKYTEKDNYSKNSKNHHVTYFEGPTYNSQSQFVATIKMKGSCKGTFSETFTRRSGAPIYQTRHWEFDWGYKAVEKLYFDSFDASKASTYSRPIGVASDIPVISDISIKINIYDKSALLAAMQKLDAQFDVVGSQMSAVDQTKFSNFRTEVTELLSKRGTDQTEIDAMKTRVESYVFDLQVSKPTCGSESYPIEMDYVGNDYWLPDLWPEYSSKLNAAGDTLAKFLTGPVISYAKNKDDIKTQNGVNQTFMKNAGYYSLALTPMPDTTYGTYRAGGTAGDIKVRYYWKESADRNTVTIWFRIKPATMTVTLPADSYDVDYNGDSPNVINGLRQGDKDATFEIVNSALNKPEILLSTDYIGPNWGVWEDEEYGLTDKAEIQGIGAHTIYYAVNADNHDPVFSSFTVNVVPATVSVKLKTHTVTYGDLMESSGDLFNLLLADDTPNILDATTKDKTLEYLHRFFNFQVLANDNSVIPEGTRTQKGTYTAGVAMTEEGSNCIAEVQFNGTNADAYVVNAKSITVEWTDSSNKWYDNARGHRPSADIVDKTQICSGDSVSTNAVGVAGNGISLDDPNVEVPLVNSNAISAGNYVATVDVDNVNYVVSNDTHPFQILKRKISISIGDRTRRYALSTTADNVVDEYKNVILAQNTTGAYVAELDSELVGKTASDNAILGNYNTVFDVNIAAARTPDNDYFTVGTHTLQFVSQNNANYEITSSQDGVFTVTPAPLVVSDGNLDAMTYKGDYQDIILDKYNALTLAGYEKNNINDTTVQVEYSDTGVDGPWRSECYQIKDVRESGKRIYYKVTATNHTTAIDSFVQEMLPVTISITLAAEQTETVYYGESKFDSASITRVLGIDFEQYSKDLNLAQIFEFYLLNDETHAPVVTVNEMKSRYYNVQYRLRAEANELDDNFSVTFKDNANENAYFVTKKPLQVNWKQTGAGWSGENQDKYTFSNGAPTVFPIAGESEGVVTGDSIHFEAKELSSRYVGTYTVSTALTTQYNKDRYEVIEDYASHEFEIIPLDISIVVDEQRATYGRAQEVPIGALVDPVTNPTAIWDYAEGSATFYEDHFRNYKFFTDAKTADGALKDVGRYTIGILPNDEVGDGSIRQNYNLSIANTDTAYFYIEQATIHYTGREFNIDVDNPDEAHTISVSDLTKRVSTGIASIDKKIADEGINSVFSSIKLSDKFLTDLPYDYDDANLQWVTTTTYNGNEPNKYYVWFIVEGNGNFKEFRAKVALNLLTKWVTVTLGNGVTVEYGTQIDNNPASANYTFKDLDITSITGFKKSDDTALGLEESKTKLMDYVRFIVGAGDLNSEIDEYANVGDYSIFMQKVSGAATDYENFRFYFRDNNGTLEDETSNINAYHIVPKVIHITYGDVDEIYGSHGNSHTEFTLVGVLPNDVSKVRVELVHGIADIANNENASMLGGHAHTVGTYTIYAKNLIGSSNYVFDDSDEGRGTTFTISPKELNIELKSRSFTYGVQNASLDPLSGIGYALNVYSETPHYIITDSEKTAFVGNDKRVDIFEIFLENTGAAIPSEFAYLPVSSDVYSYAISARPANTDVAKNYIINEHGLVKGTLTINPADLAFTVKELPRMYFDATEQDVEFNYDWIVVQGDKAYNKDKDNVKLWYKQLSREEVREETPVYQEGTEFKIKDAGKYELQLKIAAPNHKEFESGVITLYVDRANVIITLKPVSKVYGDQLGDFTTSTLSDWIKNKGELKIQSTRPSAEGAIVKDITANAKNDFVFYVVDPNNSALDDPELPIGNYTNNVGKYRIHHKFAEGALAYNYVVTYAQNCDVDAYEITKRDVTVQWMTDDADGNWKASADKEYYYTGSRPTLIAKFKSLTDTELVPLDVRGNGAESEYAVGKYSAYVEFSTMDGSLYLQNYNLTNTACAYSIIPRPVTVKINNQGGLPYGSYGVNPSLFLAPGEFEVEDGVLGGTYTLPGNPIELFLYLEDVDLTGKTYLPAGEYEIRARFSGNDNYDPTMVNAVDSSKNWGKFNVARATINYTQPNSNLNIPYLGIRQEFDLKQLLAQYVTSSTFVDEDDAAIWAGATVTVVQDGAGVANPYYDRAGEFTISYTIEVENYVPLTIASWTFNINKGHARLDFANAVSSVYGDDITDAAALSERIIAQSGVYYNQESDVLSVDFADLGRFFVADSATGNNPVDAGNYVIGFELYAEHSDNFDVVTGAGSYVIQPKELNIVWTLTDGDDYVYSNTVHSVSASLDGILDGDEGSVSAIYNAYSHKDAGKYTAGLYSYSGNDNYVISADNPTRTFKWEIKPRPIEVVWSVGEYEYNGSEHKPTVEYKPNSGLCVGDTYLGFVVTGAVNAGEQTAYVTTVSSNYTVANNEQTFTIAPKPINLIWNDTQFVYDGTVKSPTARIDRDGLIAGDEAFDVQEIGGAQKNAGSYTASIVNLGNSNYAAINNTADFVISPKEIEIHWGNTELPYNGTEQAPSYVTNGVVKGDDIGLIITGKGVDANSSYTATVTGLSNPNYVISNKSAKTISFSINKSVNEFVEMPAIGSDLKELPWINESDIPKAKFGETVIKYYTDKECTKEYTGDPAKAKEGTYWIKAYVDGTSNYDAIESAVIEVNIDKGFNKAAAASLISISAVMLIALFVLTLVINSKKKKGGRA